MRVILKNFRLIDEETDINGTVIIENGLISEVLPAESRTCAGNAAAMLIDGGFLSASGMPLLLMPAFVDLHAHFRDLVLPESLPSETSPAKAAPLAEVSLPSEVLESASLAAAAGGFGTVVCMANTKPAIDTPEKITHLKKRSDALGLIDLYPVMSLTKGMEGKELSEIKNLSSGSRYAPLMLSEDGKDLADDELFLAAMKEAKRLGIPVSCHCDFGGGEALAAKAAGKNRNVWSRIEENNATLRAIELGRKAGCRIHIAHVSTKEAVAAVARAKAEYARGGAAEAGGFSLTCEAMPHNLCLTEEDAQKLGDESFGRVNPPLRSEDDRKALIRALADGTIDAIATDHAPHTMAAKASGAPGFSGFETAFAAVFTELVRNDSSGFPAGITPGNPLRPGTIDLKRLSSLMSANPARLLGLGGGSRGSAPRGRILPGYRADLAAIDITSPWVVDPEVFKSRGKNSPFAGRKLYGKILMTLHAGRVVFHSTIA